MNLVAFEKKEIFIRKREREKRKKKSDYIMFDAQVLRILLDDSSIHLIYLYEF